MNFRVIGDRIGQETMDEQLAQGEKFNVDLNGQLPNADQGTDLQRLMARIFGTCITRHVPGYVGTTTSAPNTGAGLDFPVPSICTQVDGSGNFVEVWWKSGVNKTDWSSFGGGWPQIDFDPSASGHTAPVTTIVWQMAGTPALPVAVWIKSGLLDTDWSKFWPSSGGSGSSYYKTILDLDLTQEPDETFDAGDGQYSIGGVNWVIRNKGHAMNVISQQSGSGLFIATPYGDTVELADNAPHVCLPFGFNAAFSGGNVFPSTVKLQDLSEVWIWQLGTICVSAQSDGTPLHGVDAETGASYGIQTAPWGASTSLSLMSENDYFCSYNVVTGPPRNVLADHYLVLRNGVLGSGGAAFGLDTAGMVSSTDGGATSLANDLTHGGVFVTRLIGTTTVEFYTGVWDGGWPSRDSLCYRGRALFGRYTGRTQSVWRQGLADAGCTGTLMSYGGDLAATFAVTGGGTTDSISKRATLRRIRIDYSTYGTTYSSGGGGGGGEVDAFTAATISASAITGFGAARKLYLSGGGTLSGIDATGCVAGTTLECTLDADTVVSSTNTTVYAGIAMPSGVPSDLSLAQYSRFSAQLISPTGGSSFWQLRI